MNLSLSLPIRRILAILLLLLPFAAALEFLILPAASRYSEIGDAIERSAQLLSRYRRNNADKDDLVRSVAAHRKVLSGIPGFIAAPNLPLASSNLQSSARRLLESAGASIRVLSVLPPVRENGYDKLTGRIEFSVSAERLIATIHTLETSVNPALVIEAMEVRASEAGSQSNKADENAILTVRIDASGYWMPQ
jgi:hypothetical protein